MPKYVIVLGTSHYPGLDYLSRAVSKIEQMCGVQVCGESSVYKSSAYLSSYNSAFYNKALAVSTQLAPIPFYRELFAFEHNLGRIRSYVNCRRTIDIDLFFCLDFTYKTANFFLPHQDGLQRKFFVEPAYEALKHAKWPLPYFMQNARIGFMSQNCQK